MLENLFLVVLNLSFTGSVVILFVFVARLFLKKAPKRFSFVLWAVAAFRLICPISVKSAFSLLPINPTPLPTQILYAQVPKIDTGITIIDSSVNAVLPGAALTASVNPLQIWATLGSYLWTFGILALLLYSVFSLFILRKKLKNVVWVKENIYRSCCLPTAFVFGVLRPKIYLPADLTQQEEDFILLHEKSHIRRFDPLIKLFSFLILTIHWFNPLVWLAFFASGKDMEMACDEAVIRRLGNGVKKEYSASLLRLATGKSRPLGSLLAFGEGDTKGRIQNVLQYKKPAFWGLAAAGILAGVLILGFAVNPKEDAPLEYWGVNAAILSIDSSAKTMTVQGIDEASVIGDSCIIDYADADLLQVASQEQTHEVTPLTIDNFSVNDYVVLFIGDVQETYPTTAKARTIQLQEKAALLESAADIRQEQNSVFAINFSARHRAFDGSGQMVDSVPFTLYITLPQGFTIAPKPENDLRFPLTGVFASFGIYNAEEKYIGAVGFCEYEEYEGAEKVPQAIYSQIALANHYHFSCRPEEEGGAYRPVAVSAAGETAVTQVYTSALLAADMGLSGEQVNPGILSYDSELLSYIAIELEAGVLSDSEIADMAGSIRLVRQNLPQSTNLDEYTRLARETIALYQANRAFEKENFALLPQDFIFASVPAPLRFDQNELGYYQTSIMSANDEYCMWISIDDTVYEYRDGKKSQAPFVNSVFFEKVV